MRTRLVLAALIAVCLAAGLNIGVWLLRNHASRTPSARVALTGTVAVVEGEVRNVVTLPGTMRWPTQEIHAPGITGTVTSTNSTGIAVIDEGDILLSVDLRPVRVAVGAIPMFRDINSDSFGLDVYQVRRFLCSQVPDECHEGQGNDSQKYDNELRRVIRAWRSLNWQLRDDTIHSTEILFMPELPATVVVDTEAGSEVAPSETFLRRFVGEPVFTVRVGGNVPQQIGATTSATVQLGTRSWDATLHSRPPPESAGDDTGSVTGESTDAWYELRAPSGGPLCGDCADVTVVEDETAISVAVELVPHTEGPAVPMSALGHDGADGSFFVVDAQTAERIRVEVLARHDGIAIVRGVDVGSVVRAIGS